jgi:phage host-nuclease inhibitor protein Gam
MKRTLCILLLGLLGGLGAHVGWLTASGAQRPGDLNAQLAWMKTSLRLDEAQLARIKALHEQSAPQLLALAEQVEGMREELAAFEHERIKEGRIDFLEFARFVEKRRRLDRECVLSTERLVAAAAEVMTPQQREQYLSLLGPALKTARTHPPG